MSLQKYQISVLDGGFATQLCRHVGDVVDGNPLWSALFLATNPEAIVQTHLDFLRAGAELIITNTYQASVNGFMTHLGLNEEQSILLIKEAVKLAKKACDIFMKECGSLSNTKRPQIVGSVGPYGAHLHDYSEYTGSYVDSVSKLTMIEWHRPRIQALIEAGVDLLALETIPAQAEAEALLELLKEFPEQKAWLAFSCKDEKHTSHGENFEECVRLCWNQSSSQLVAVGTNCLNPKYITPLIKNINTKHNKRIPIVVYPNSGETFDPEKGWINKEETVPIESYVQEWLNLGANYIGGCCRTYAEDVSNIKKEINNWISKNNHIIEY